MESESPLEFGPFRVESRPDRLWRGDQAITLRPQSLALLRYLVEHAGRLVSKTELRQQVWGGTHVSDNVLRVGVHDIRQALGDRAAAPQYLETVGRQGYLWIGPPPAAPLTPLGASRGPAAGRVVGREALLAQLHARLAQAQAGSPQVVLLSGEAGLGKTTVVDSFLAQIAALPGLWLGRGQCQSASSEAYFPVFEALGQLGRGAGQAPLVRALSRYAPHWLAQLPSMLDPAALEAAQRRDQGATPARMLREGVELLEALSAEGLLVLVLEDLRWSDQASLELLAHLAKRRGPAHLLLLGTYRPETLNAPEAPLTALTLALQLQGAVLSLRVLTLAEVRAYLAGSPGSVPAGLAEALHRRTEGHPLFLASVVDTLVQQGVLRQHAGQWRLTQPLVEVETIVPETLRQFILHQYASLNPQAQALVAAASVLGPEGAFAALAAGLATDVDAVEACGAALLQQGHFLRPAGETIWPDGTITACYRFRHALYQQVVYAQVPMAQRQRLHQRLGARLEAAYGAQAGGHAAELLRHFTWGGDRVGVVRYGQLAAATALQRGAYAEALAALQQGLATIETLPETPDRDRQELAYRLTLGSALIATQGAAAPEVQQTYTRAQVLSGSVGTPEQRFHALDGLRQHAEAATAFDPALTLAEAALALAEALADPVLIGHAHVGLGSVLFYQGGFAPSLSHLGQGLQALDSMLLADTRVAVACRSLAAMGSWYLGAPDQARGLAQQALVYAEALADPATLGWTLVHVNAVYYLCGDVAAMQTHTAALEVHATAHGLAVLASMAAGFRGWIAVQQKRDPAGLEQTRQAFEAYQATGRRAGGHLMALLLAECYGQLGQPAAGLAVLAPLAGPIAMEAERYRLQGVLLAAMGQAAAAEACLHQALSVARRQRALSLELRAALALFRLASTPAQRATARQRLAKVYSRFTAGFDTADLQAAWAYLDAGAESHAARTTHDGREGSVAS